MLKRIITPVLLGNALLCAGWWLHPTASAQRSNNLERGRQLYYQYCASCHGEDGRGTGPVAASLKAVVPDLHKIAKENAKFPQLRVKNIISGEVDVSSHGSKEMPVWGRVFREAKGNSVSQLNLYALMKYIEAMQEK
jgi:mono/diheme cytochrome c family protein